MSEQSESIGKLALALSKLQGEIQNIFADKKGYNYTYVDLASILEISRPLLAKHELALLQTPCNPKLESGIPDPNIVGVKSILMHSSGEYISETAYMQLTTTSKGMNLAQAAGSIITYARRYAFAAMMGIAQTDNDASNVEANIISDTTYAKIVDLIEGYGLQNSVQKWKNHYEVDKLSALTEIQGNTLIGTIVAKYKGSPNGEYSAGAAQSVMKTQAEQLAGMI